MKIIKIKKLVILFALLLAPVFAFAGCAAVTNPPPAGYVSGLSNPTSNAIGKGSFIPSPLFSPPAPFLAQSDCYYLGGKPGGASVYAEVENMSGVKGLHFAAFLNYYLNKIYCGSADKQKATYKLFVNVVYYGPDVYPYTKRGSVANGFGGPVKNYKIKQQCNNGISGNCGDLIVVDFRYSSRYSNYKGTRLAINAISRDLNQKTLKALFVEKAASQIVISLNGNA